MPNEPISEQVLRLRNRKGWTQSELGQRAGVSGKLIWKIEHGGETSTRALRQIAEALDCDYNGELQPRSENKSTARQALVAAAETLPEDLVGTGERLLRNLHLIPGSHLDIILGVVKIFEEDER